MPTPVRWACSASFPKARLRRVSEELKPQAQAASVVTTAESAYLEEIKKIDNPAERLKESLEGLEDYGDFDLLETMADGLENMNPESRAAKKIFLQDSEFAEQRKHLKTDLLMWLNILDSDATTASEAVEKCQEAAKAAEKKAKAEAKAEKEAAKA